jgi:hypothetical protein
MLKNIKTKIVIVTGMFALAGLFTTSALVANAQNDATPAGWGIAAANTPHVGPAAGTSVVPPTSDAPRITGLTAPTKLDVGEEGTWSLNVIDPLDGSLTYSVDWGDPVSVVRAFALTPFFEQTGTFSHTYSAPGVYTVTFTVANEEGLTNHASVTVQVGAPSEQDSPVITELKVSAVKKDHATIAWNTDGKTAAKVWVSKTKPVNTNASPKAERAVAASRQTIRLNNLEANTTYFVVVRSTDENGNSTDSAVISFKTKAH